VTHRLLLKLTQLTVRRPSRRYPPLRQAQGRLLQKTQRWGTLSRGDLGKNQREGHPPRNAVNMKRKRLTQIVLVIVGLVNLAMIYFLYMDLRHSSWLLEKQNETEPMFLSFFIPVGVFLLMAARKPAEHRSMIALAAWWNISHGTVMAIQTVEAWNHGVHRNFADVILFLVIGVSLLVLLPAKQQAIAPRVG
jgi:hypothetical protein